MAKVMLFALWGLLLPLVSTQTDRDTTQVLQVDFLDMPPFIYTNCPGENQTKSPASGPSPKGSNTLGIKGLMADVLREIVAGCYPTNSTLSYRRVPYGQGDLEGDVEADFSIPVTRTHMRQSFYGQFADITALIPLLESPGILYLSCSGYSTAGPVSAVLSAWPLVLLIFLTSSLAGCVIWICERLASTGEFPDKFGPGFGEALWLALVTMTTVGYGDRKPSSPVGRVVTSVWILVGLVVITIFTATLTTAFNFEGSEDVEIRGHKIGVLNDSITEEVAYMWGAEPEVFPSTKALLAAGSMDRSLQGFLLESLHAQFYSRSFSDHGYLVLKLLRSPLVYGILTREQNETTKTCMVTVATRVRAKITRRCREKSEFLPIKAKKGAKSSSKVWSMLGVNVPLLVALSVVLVLLIGGALIVDRYYMTHACVSDKLGTTRSAEQLTVKTRVTQLNRTDFGVEPVKGDKK